MAEERMRPAVLVADDDAMVRVFMVRCLERLGYVVVDVPSGEAALQAYQQGSFSFVVLDVSMPGMGGIAAGDALRALSPAVPVLYMSGVDERARLGARLLVSNTAFLEKPCTVDALRDAIDGILRGAG